MAQAAPPVAHPPPRGTAAAVWGPGRPRRLGGGAADALFRAAVAAPPREPRAQPAPHRGSDVQGARPRAACGDGARRRSRRAFVERLARVIAIVDYGVGNVHSVRRALNYVGAEAELTSDVDELERANGIV